MGSWMFRATFVGLNLAFDIMTCDRFPDASIPVDPDEPVRRFQKYTTCNVKYHVRKGFAYRTC